MPSKPGRPRTGRAVMVNVYVPLAKRAHWKATAYHHNTTMSKFIAEAVDTYIWEIDHDENDCPTGTACLRVHN